MTVRNEGCRARACVWSRCVVVSHAPCLSIIDRVLIGQEPTNQLERHWQTLTKKNTEMNAGVGSQVRVLSFSLCVLSFSMCAL